MAKNLIKTSKEIVPVIYAYTTPDYPPHDGWTKIGDTRYGVDRRIEQQVGTADITYKREWVMNAVYEGTTETFRDYAFHAYLQKQGVERKTRVKSNGKTVNTEWFKIEPMDARNRLVNFKADRGILEALGAIPYSLRDEQIDAVVQTKEYFEAHAENKPEFLWNAKPRFGKTLTAYDLCTALKAKNILIVTNRPAIANSWYSDYEKFFGTESGYYFISENDSLKGKKAVYTYKQLVEDIRTRPNYKGCIMFVSLQDLKGSLFMGGKHDKLEYLTTELFDVLIVDEAHEGVDTSKTDLAFRQINRKHILHLSGTPFKALANDKFEVAAIFNWTYADEQKAKRDWSDEDRSNPYVDLPRLNLFTYRMSDIAIAKVKEGADFDNDGENEAYAFDLNEFFKTYDSGKNKGEFIHDADIDLFLDQLVTTEKFPFSEEYRDELQHTLWLLNRVASAKALYKKLKVHPVFKDYEIVLAAGDGKVEENGVADETEVKKSYDKVVKAIAENDRTITLSVGQLTTGITIPEWSGVMMLSNMQSPALYMQAAFRSQNPYTYTKDGKTYRKENAYVFDFDPARTLDIFEQFATGLYSDTTGNKGDIDTRKNRVRELINFFPVYGEDNTGGMIELDAEQVLSIPRQIHAQEVVRKGFMSNFLFQNISGVFAAPKAVTDILTKLDAAKEPVGVDSKTAEELNINADGEVEIPDDKVKEQVEQVFGDKIYSDLDIGYLVDAVNDEKEKQRGKKSKDDALLEELKKKLHDKTDELISIAKDKYGKELSKSAQVKMVKEINQAADDAVAQRFGDYRIEGNRIENDRQKAVAQAESEGRIADIEGINARANEAHENNIRHFEESMLDVIPDTTKKAAETIVKIQETDKCEKEKKSIEGDIRDRLRGFSRTIPSFLMAYGDENTTLENFDTIIPENVFLEVTGITVDEFRFLRDGGDYTAVDGSTKHFEGHLFDSVVFNDSVVEFLRKRDELSDYFADGVVEDIFDYIPPQRTNQIFTPKKVVKQMVDYLEQENPGCFDSMDATFIDPYMKSGLYITEIVKRLFNNKEHKDIFPDEIERLHWIFETQVYGLAPTEIIYRITTNYILGFTKKQEWIDKCKEKNFVISDAHFKLCDSLPYAQGNEKLTLEQKLTELFK